MNTGIICEFNPFHNGHKYLIDTVKENSVIGIMSGNFVQRGVFAVYNKKTRAKTALENGVDLVIELPTVYSTLSAEGFAKSGVELIQACGVADRIAFGAECDDEKKLYELSKQIKTRHDEISIVMKTGLSYPAARKAVINSPILDTPNNILALEYISATNLPCLPVKRIGKGHDTDDKLYSASAIRNTLSKDDICSIDNCQKAILAVLRTMSSDDFLQINDVGDGLENRIFKAVREATDIEELYSLIKTKRFTHSRIRRIVLRSFLGIKKSDVLPVPYIRVLGFNNKGKDLLKEMKKKSTLPIVTRTSDIEQLGEDAKHIFNIECRCSDLYNLGYKKTLPCSAEQRYQIVSI